MPVGPPRGHRQALPGTAAGTGGKAPAPVAESRACSAPSACRRAISRHPAQSYGRADDPTRLAPHRQAVQEFITTCQGYGLATSTGGVLTGRGADIILIDDPLKPDEALSEAQRQACNQWFVHTLYSRLNDKRHGAIVIIMQRLHEDDLVGRVLAQEQWQVLSFPAIAEVDEVHEIETILGPRRFTRRQGGALPPDGEPLEVLARIRRTIGEYNFAGQYQQSPAPLGGGLVKAEWFKRYRENERPDRFDRIVQSWDTANKATELSDFSVCTTWGVKGKDLFLLDVFRRRLEYPALKRAVRDRQSLFNATVVLIEDKASGTQLIQELIAEGCYAVTRYLPTTDKTMRLHAQTAIIENGFVRIPEEAPWLAEYLHELTVFPKGKHDDQADSTAQFLEWYNKPGPNDGYIDWLREAAEEKNKQRQPEPREPNYAIGSVQWEEKQKKRRAADLARAQAEDKIIAERAAAAEEDAKREPQRAAAAAAPEA